MRLRRSEGLTLVEMLAALAISAALAAAAMGAAAHLSRSGRMLEAGRDRAALETGLERLLAGDVRNADRWAVLGDGIALRTTARLDPKDLEMRHLPSEVSYRIRRIAGHGWLTKRQRSANAPDHVELVCRGASRIRLICDGEEQENSRKWRAMPARLEIIVTLDDPDRSKLRFAYTLR